MNRRTLIVRSVRRDNTTDEARENARLYGLKAWRDRRAAQLRRKPLCERCEKQGLTVIATTANHRIPHKRDWIAFITGDLESLCSSCHSGPVQSEERRGYSTQVDASGQPTDPRHPWNSN